MSDELSMCEENDLSPVDDDLNKTNTEKVRRRSVCKKEEGN